MFYEYSDASFAGHEHEEHEVEFCIFEHSTLTLFKIWMSWLTAWSI